MPRGRPRGSKNKPREIRGGDDHAANGSGGGGGEEATRFANTKVRGEIIRKACRDITELEEQRKTISQEIAAIKQSRIKGDLGMKIADFNASLRLYRLEGDDRKTFFDVLRETFSALLPGEQADFFVGLVPDDDGQAEAATAPQAAEAPPPREPSPMAKAFADRISPRKHTEDTISTEAIGAAQAHLYGDDSDFDAGEDDFLNDPRPAA